MRSRIMVHVKKNDLENKIKQTEVPFGIAYRLASANFILNGYIFIIVCESTKKKNNTLFLYFFYFIW